MSLIQKRAEEEKKVVFLLTLKPDHLQPDERICPNCVQFVHFGRELKIRKKNSFGPKLLRANDPFIPQTRLKAVHSQSRKNGYFDLYRDEI